MSAEPPDSPPECHIPTRPCPLCGQDMEHDGRWGWRCDGRIIHWDAEGNDSGEWEACGGRIEDSDDYDWDAAWEAREDR